MTLFRCSVVVLLSCLSTVSVVADDVVNLKSGSQVRGRLISQDDKYVQIEIKVNGRLFVRRFPSGIVASVTKDAAPATGTGTSRNPVRSVTEVQQLIQSTGSVPPDWLADTPLKIPATLELTWQQPPKGPWDNSKNVGQFIWDRINPNPGQWRNGVKLMHHIMKERRDNKRVVALAKTALGNMYHNLFKDHARAAYWWQQAGVDRGQGESHATLHLADSYFQLGNKVMAQNLLKKMKRYPLGVIKLLGDMGETERALKLANSYARGNNTVACYLYAGDVCRVAGRLDDAEQYYRKALAAADKDSRNESHAIRDKGRAKASLAAIKFFRLSPKNVSDGTYSARSLGYEDQIDVQVVVKSGRMTDVRVTNHREKQFYSSIEDTPRNLLRRQAFLGIDTTSGATITSEAIINATAKALSKGQR
jgi:uncharacterized protein with FMN-binding domain